MIKVGITGQSGFVGTHLYNTLGLYPGEFERVPFEDDYFVDVERLKTFVKSCDVIVHLAAVNRHTDAHVLYETNMRLVKQLIEAMETTNYDHHSYYDHTHYPVPLVCSTRIKHKDENLS